MDKLAGLVVGAFLALLLCVHSVEKNYVSRERLLLCDKFDVSIMDCIYTPKPEGE